MPKNLPKNHFSEIDLQQQWEIFLSKIKEEDFVLYSAIRSFRTVKKDESTIVLFYPSETAKATFDRIQGEFLNHFRRVVNNQTIMAEYEMDEKLKQEVMTKRKLFDKMAKLNPLLNNLNEIMRFDLS